MIQNKFLVVVFAFCVLLQLQLKAQVFKGKVISANDNKTIAYVNIGIVGKDVGTVSNTNGEFSITLLE